MTGTVAPPRRPGRSFAIVVAWLAGSWGPAVLGLALAMLGGRGLEAVGTFSGALSFGATAALLPLRGGHGGRGGPLLPLTLAVAAAGAGLSTLASGLRAVGAVRGGGAAWLDAMGVGWMPGGLTVVGVLGAAMMLRSRALLAAGALLSAAITTVSALELQEQRPFPLAVVLWVLWLALALGTVLMLLWVARRHPPPDRDAAVWLALAQLAALVSGAGGYVIDSASGASFLATTFAAAFVPAAVVFHAAAFLLAAIARAPAALDPALARICVGVLLIAAFVTAYGAVAATAAQVGPLTPATAGMIAVVVLAVAAEPVRRWVRRAVDQLLYGRSADPRALLRTVSREIAAAGGTGTLDSLAEALRRSLRLGGVAIRSAMPGGPSAVAGTIDPATVRSITLLTADGASGLVEVSADWARRVDRRTLAAVQRIGGVLSVAVRLAEINDDLRDARLRAHRIAASERRFARSEIEARIEPALDGIRTDLRSTAHVADPLAALRRAGAALQAAATETRDLARTLLPGSLDAGDLPGALAELAARFESPRLAATIAHVPERPEAVYHLVAEAVLRARRVGGIDGVDVHVRAGGRCDLTLSGDAGRIEPIREALLARAVETGHRPVPGRATLSLIREADR